MQGFPKEYTGPGLVDLQINGYSGVDFNCLGEELTAEKFHTVRKALNARGVLVVLPTFITDDAEAMVTRAKRYARIVESDSQLLKTFPKLHIEGPFISAQEGTRGAHPARHTLIPSKDGELIDRINDACGGRIGILALAPELSGAPEMIRKWSDANVCVAIGHCKPSNEDIDRAVDAGAKMSTHLGNGSEQMLPRLDNYLQKQLSADALFASFIADGHHMPFTTLQNFIRAKMPQHVVLVTDAISAAELGPGTYDLGGEAVHVYENGLAAKPGQKNLSGSTITLDMTIVNVVRHCGISLDDAWTMGSSRPAELVNLPTPADVTVKISEAGFAKV